MTRVRAGLGRVRRSVPAGRERVEATEAELARLRARVAELEAQVRELRGHQHRVAELTDVVQELLVPLSQRDVERVEETLARYTSELGS